MTIIKFEEDSGLLPVNGGKVFYVRYGNLNSKNWPLVVIHGGPGFSHDTMTVLKPLAKNRALIFYDQLGCGLSDKTDNKKLWTIEHYASELFDIIKYFGLKKYHLLGHSFGGSIAIEHGLTQPAGLQSIILSSPLISVRDWLADTNIRKRELPSSIQLSIEMHESNNTLESSEYKEAIKEFNQQFLCRLTPKPEIYLKALKDFNIDIYKYMWGPSEFNCTGSLASYEREHELNSLKIPVLFLCGEYDEVREETLKKYQTNTLINSYLRVILNSAHNTYLESTEEFIQEVELFLKKVEIK